MMSLCQDDWAMVWSVHRVGTLTLRAVAMCNPCEDSVAWYVNPGGQLIRATNGTLINDQHRDG